MPVKKLKVIESREGKPIKQILKELYDRHGSQEFVADELGVSQSTVSQWFKQEGLTMRRKVEAKEAKVI